MKHAKKNYIITIYMNLISQKNTLQTLNNVTSKYNILKEKSLLLRKSYELWNRFLQLNSK